MYLTEQEILNRQREQLFGIHKFIKNSNVSLDDISEVIPGIVHLNKINTLDLVYFDRQTRELLELKKDDIHKRGREILTKIVKPESFQEAKRLFATKDFKDPFQVFSHFQAVKGISDKNAYQWCYSVKKGFDEGLILTVTHPLNTLGTTQKQIEKVIEENLFIKQNLLKIESLTDREKQIIILISRDYNSSQIAEKLSISPHTVNTHRKNIWRKLEIKNYTALLKFAKSFDLL